MGKIETSKNFAIVEQPESTERPFIHLPPPHAFKEPEKWLRKIPYEEKLTLPVDDRGFLKTDEAIRSLLDEFDPDYRWEYMPDVPESAPDKHHKYFYRNDFYRLSLRLQEMGVQNWKMPMKFRDNPSNILLIPGLFHNFWHHASQKVGKPEYDDDPQRLVKLELEDMSEFLVHFNLAKRALLTASKSAANILRIEGQATARSDDMLRRFGPEGNDPVGDAFIKDSLERYFRGYKMGIQALQSGARLDLIFPPGEQVVIEPEPTYEQIIQIGQKSVRGAINYLPHFRSKAA